MLALSDSNDRSRYMSPDTPIRLEYERPPLIEQAISVGFEPLAGFRIVDYGLFWSQIASEFPEVSSEAALDNPTELFEGVRPSSISFNLLAAPPMPRAMFRSGDGELVQIQPDRFGFNWAKEGEREYPRSEAVMARFEKLFERFLEFVKDQNLGEFVMRQCELTNLNIIPVPDFGVSYGDITRALNLDPLDLGLNYLVAETYIRNRQHRIVETDGTPIGRLHTAISPVISNADNSQAFRLEFTARSAPTVRTIEQARRFFGVARNAINGAFDALVSDDMKRKWGAK